MCVSLRNDRATFTTGGYRRPRPPPVFPPTDSRTSLPDRRITPARSTRHTSCDARRSARGNARLRFRAGRMASVTAEDRAAPDGSAAGRRRRSPTSPNRAPRNRAHPPQCVQFVPCRFDLAPHVVHAGRLGRRTRRRRESLVRHGVRARAAAGSPAWHRDCQHAAARLVGRSTSACTHHPPHGEKEAPCSARRPCSSRPCS